MTTVCQQQRHVIRHITRLRAISVHIHSEQDAQIHRPRPTGTGRLGLVLTALPHQPSYSTLSPVSSS